MVVIEWFEINYRKLNQDKCHFLLSVHKHEIICTNIGKTKIWESRKQKLLRIIINLHFDEYILNQCKKASFKLGAHPRKTENLNYRKLNQDKCHFLLSVHKHEIICTNIGKTKIWESRKQKLLGIIINLHFDEYILNQCKKASFKLGAHPRKTENLNESFHWIAIWVLPTYLGVLRKKFK